MPEGHTLHRLALDLTAAFAGSPVRVSSPQGRFADEAAMLDGQVVVGAEAWGKQLFVYFDGPVSTSGVWGRSPQWGSTGAEPPRVHVHLGLYGKLQISPYVAEPPLPVGQVRLRLTGTTAYADLRGATACDLWTLTERDACVARLGPDPLRDDAQPERAWDRVRRSRSPIGGLLMDQGVLAGVGNVYRAEVLFRHRVDPMRPGNTIIKARWDAIWADLVELMKDGVEKNRIDTVRPEHMPDAMGRLPRVDDHGGEVYVYRRAGQPCHVCGREVRTAELQGRNLFWCPRCQRGYRPSS